MRHSIELSMRLHHQGNFLAVSSSQLRSLHQKLQKAALILDMKDLPELFVYQDPRPNAYTFGVEKCSVAISTGCLDLMTDDEVLCVLAHELGHIKASHVLYKTATRILSTMADSLAQRTLGLGGVVLYPIQLALLRWDRASELSCDRAALLVVKNPKIVLTTLMKLAGATHALQKELSIKAFTEQAQNFEKTQDEGPLGKYIGLMNSMFVSHPFPIWRAKEIIDWVESGEYFAILQGRYATKSKKNPPAQTASEGDSSASYSASFEKTLGNVRSWYDKTFNLPKDD
jgi:Zn-dependent protease with chaperone function